jgi:hypothetical protein
VQLRRAVRHPTPRRRHPLPLHIDAAGPTGQRWASAWSTNFQLPSAMKFMVLPQITLPIEPNGGRHVYSFRLDGSHERFDILLDVLMQ